MERAADDFAEIAARRDQIRKNEDETKTTVGEVNVDEEKKRPLSADDFLATWVRLQDIRKSRWLAAFGNGRD